MRLRNIKKNRKQLSNQKQKVLFQLEKFPANSFVSSFLNKKLKNIDQKLDELNIRNHHAPKN